MMKAINYIYILAAGMLFLFPSCNEDERLTEVPLSFYSPENSYVTKANFQTAVNNLYFLARSQFSASDEEARYQMFHGNDFAYNATAYKPAQLEKLNSYNTVMVPNSAQVLNVWRLFYQIVRDANVVLTRIDAPASKVAESDKPLLKAEALFFRAYAYRWLAHLYGGVPILREEATTAKRDYVRDTRENVYKQCISDLETAISYGLPNVDNATDGKVNKQVAQHLMAELYISLKQYGDAVSAANSVINYNVAELKLMTTRFGKYQTVTPGDPYWDLFQQTNQNRASGNKESLWVFQYDAQNAGSTDMFNWPRFFLSQWRALAGDDGKVLFMGSNGGTDKKGGRGIGWIRPTSHFLYEIWTDGTTDLRNSPYIMVRDFQVNNPESKYYRQWIVADNVRGKFSNMQEDTTRNWYPFMTKCGITRDFPAYAYDTSRPDLTFDGERELNNSNNNPSNSYKDFYAFRLAETYLLLAEANLLNGNKAAAAAAINAVRSRANATLAAESEINMDYILDERLRELYTEEPRMLTLCRTGLQYDRTRRYNHLSGDPALGNIQEKHNLWPIPYSEILYNTLAVLEQNPQYAN